MIWIVTDSAQEHAHQPEKGLYVISLPLLINQKELEGGLSREKFYELLEDDDVSLTTSQATPFVYEQIFDDLGKDGSEIVCLTVSSTLSGCFNSARIAAQGKQNVHVVDSNTACLAQSALVSLALELKEQGKSAKEIADQLEEEKHNVRLLAAIPSLKYLRKGGRISPAAAAAGDFIKLRPIVTVDEDGQVAVAAKSRGTKKALKNTAEMALEEGIDFDRPVVFGYSGLSDENAKALKAFFDEGIDRPMEEKYLALSRILAVHAGPDAAGIGYFRKKQ